MNAQCETCGAAFPPSHKRRFCQPCALERARARKRIEPIPKRGCVECGAEFRPLRDSAVTCSRKCGGELGRRKRREETAQVAEELTEESADKLSRQDLEIQRAQIDAKNARASYQALLKRMAFEDRAIDEMKDLLQALALRPIRKPPKSVEVTAGTSSETMLLLFSDQHIGEVVSREETDGFGYYDFPTFVARYELLVSKIIAMRRRLQSGKAYAINHLVIAALGDTLSGNIHDELRETNQPRITEAIIQGAHVIAQGTRELAAEFPEVEVLGIPGNHGRFTQRPQGGKHKWDGFEHLMYQMWALQCERLENVTFRIPHATRILHEIEGHKFLFTHGDSIRGSLGIPYYGIDRADHRLASLYASRGEYYEYLCLGHFHTQAALARVKGKKYMNGSMKGTDEYSINSLHTGAEPEQTLLGVDRDHGVTFQFDLNLSAAETPARYGWGNPGEG